MAYSSDHKKEVDGKTSFLWSAML